MGVHGCPISRKMTNNCVARINAVMVVLLVILSVFWVNIWIPLFLTLDFFITGFLEKPFIKSTIARKIVGHFKWGKIINAGPKIFAAKIGFWVSLLLTIFVFKEWMFAYYFIAGILTVVAAAEAIFEFCLGCKMFPHWINFKGKLFK